MFFPRGYISFRKAFEVLRDYRFDDSEDQSQGEYLGCALASGELVAHGIVIGLEGDDVSIPEQGEIRLLRAETWRTPLAREAVLGQEPSNRLVQDRYVLAPVLELAGFNEWLNQSGTFTGSIPYAPPSLSPGVHVLPRGYLAFDQISSQVRQWVNSGQVDEAWLPILCPLDKNAVAQALGSGDLPAFGLSRSTGKVLSMPPPNWRREINGVAQAILAVHDLDVRRGSHDEICWPIISRADLAFAIGSTEIPPGPEELPEDFEHNNIQDQTLEDQQNFPARQNEEPRPSWKFLKVSRPRHDWRLFDQELSRSLTLDGGHLTRTELRKTMKEWADANMTPTPDDRTIEKRLDTKVPDDLYSPE